MPRHWPLIAALLAVGLAAWLLVGGGEKRSAQEVLEAERAAAAPPGPPAPIPGTALDAPRAGASGPREKAATGPRGSVDVRALPRGPLVISVVGADDQPLAPDDVRLTLGPAKGQRDWDTTPLLVPDPETKAWQAEQVLAGPVEVHVSGAFVVEKSVTVNVAVEKAEPVRLRVERAGAIHWTVTLAGGQVPEQVELSLLDAQERPTPARFQTQSATALGTPRTGTRLKEGPEGVVLGVKPGTYVLRARSPADEVADAKVEVVAGQTAELAIVIRG